MKLKFFLGLLMALFLTVSSHAQLSGKGGSSYIKLKKEYRTIKIDKSSLISNTTPTIKQSKISFAQRKQLAIKRKSRQIVHNKR